MKDPEFCARCVYCHMGNDTDASNRFCNFIEITGESRKCEPGRNCKRFTPRQKGVSAHQAWLDTLKYRMDKQTVARTARGEGAVSSGVCTKCGGQDRRTNSGKKYCQACYDRILKEQRAAQIERQRQHYFELKGKGICVRCATRPAVPGHTRCQQCLDLQRQDYARQRDRGRKGKES